MNHFADLISAQQYPKMQSQHPANTTWNSSAREMSFVDGILDKHKAISSK
jgi:hypothetical protein